MDNTNVYGLYIKWAEKKRIASKRHNSHKSELVKQSKSDAKVFDQALEETRRMLKWLDENPGKALPLDY